MVPVLVPFALEPFLPDLLPSSSATTRGLDTLFHSRLLLEAAVDDVGLGVVLEAEDLEGACCLLVCSEEEEEEEEEEEDTFEGEEEGPEE